MELPRRIKVCYNIRHSSLMSKLTFQIQALDTSVVNKIAAGEIIIGPSNALKEILENSIDANSTSIEVLVKEGGLKSLQITDNGTGIIKEDLPILCERFTTSKLQKFEDLTSIATYGFRGEALASISHIAHLSVTTKTREDSCAWKSLYIDGKMVPLKPRAPAEPKAVAGKDGTQIVVEDLFYNVPSRLRTLRSPNEEYGKIIDVVGRYAVHTDGVGFACKKVGDSNSGLTTRAGSSRKDRIRTVFGAPVANELLEIEISANEEFGLLKCFGQVTNSNFVNKKVIQPVFFINNRLVSCDPLKRAINLLYLTFLPKGHKPFVYMALEIDPANVDVNVHPTKREVRFLFEDEITEHIVNGLQSELSKLDSSRNFLTQQVLPNAKRLRDEDDEDRFSLTSFNKAKTYAHNLVRTDESQTKITAFTSRVENVENLGHKTKAPKIATPVESEDSQSDSDVQEDQTLITSVVSPEEPRVSLAPTLSSRVKHLSYRPPGSDNEDHISSEESAEVEETDEQSSLEQPVENYQEEPQPEEVEQEEAELEEESEEDLQDADNNVPEIPEIDEVQEDVEEEREANSSMDQEAKATRQRVRLVEKESNVEIEQLNQDPEKVLDVSSPSEDEFDTPVQEQEPIKTSILNDRRERVNIKLSSILSLREEVETAVHQELTEIFAKHTFVGIVDQERRLAAIQYDVKLYLIDYAAVSYELFYQIGLSDFGNFGRIYLNETGISLKGLLSPVYENKEFMKGYLDSIKSIDEVISILVEMKEMLNEYFAIKIDDSTSDVKLIHLPLLLDGYVPSISKLGLMIFRLGNKIDWTSEKACLDGILKQIALFYIPESVPAGGENSTSQHVFENVLFLAMKRRLLASRSLSKDVVEIANLPGLYKVFERC